MVSSENNSAGDGTASGSASVNAGIGHLGFEGKLHTFGGLHLNDKAVRIGDALGTRRK